jgi:phosphosulfolactate phosphohydrolase-like enzyme
LENFASVIDFIDGKVAITYVVAAEYSQILFFKDTESTIQLKINQKALYESGIDLT